MRKTIFSCLALLVLLPLTLGSCAAQSPVLPPALPDIEPVDITDAFACPHFLAHMRNITQRSYPEPIFDTDVANIIYLHLVFDVDMAAFPNQTISEFFLSRRAYRGLEMYIGGRHITLNQIGITSLAGIEHFSALESLWIYSDYLAELDLSRNTALTELAIAAGNLTALDVSRNTALQTLYVLDGLLHALDLSRNTALQMLRLTNNQLSTLDLSNNTALQGAWLGRNPLSALDLSNNSALRVLDLGGSQLTALDVSNNLALETLLVAHNQLTELDVSHNAALTHLQAQYNQLQALDLTNHPSLRLLVLDQNDFHASADVMLHPDVSAQLTPSYRDDNESFIFWPQRAQE